MQKDALTVFDPISNMTNPKSIPGGWVDYTITASNSGKGDVDNESVAITDPIAANVDLFVGDLSGAGSGPVDFTDGQARHPAG